LREAIQNQETGKTEPRGIPRSDFIILPLISLLTVLVPVALAESITRLIWVESIHDDCLYFDSLGARHRPFCSSRMKPIEGPWVSYQYNACGYRGSQGCGPKTPGTKRFVIMGTSIAFGLYVPEEELFTERVAPELSGILGGTVQFENMGSVGPVFPRQYEMVNEVRSLQPDGVFLVLVPYDLKSLDDPSGSNPPLVGQARRKLPQWSDLAYLARSSRAVFMAQHLLLEDRDFVEHAFVMSAGPDDVTHIPATALTQQRFERLADLFRRLASGLSERGIPLYVVPVPSRLQAVLINANMELPGVDPSAFIRRVGEIARGAGAQFIDIGLELKRAPVAESLFYAVDGHLTGSGHEVVAQSVVNYFKSAGAIAPSRTEPGLEDWR
jgi:hypothetical protein